MFCFCVNTRNDGCVPAIPHTSNKTSPLHNQPLFCRRVQADEAHVDWFDNFNRNYGTGNVKLKDGVYRAGNWTAHAIHVCSVPADQINRKIMDGKVMRDVGVPQDLLTRPSVRAALLKMMIKVDKEGVFFRRKSTIHKFDIRRVPLKPSKQDVEGNARWKSGLAMNDLSRFHPARLMAENIGSNQGLWDILHDYWATGPRSAKKSKTLRMIVADCNIFKRILKVCVAHPVEKSRSCSSRCIAVMSFFHLTFFCLVHLL